MSRLGWLLVGLLAVLVLGGTGALVIIAAATKRGVFDQVRAAVLGQLAALRPDLTDAAATKAAEIVAAQAVLETGGGRTAGWREGWNFGNVTSGGPKLWSGPVVVAGDTEYDAAGNVTNISQAFRKYDSLDAAVHDFLTVVLQWRREREQNTLGLLLAGDAAGYINALYRAGYYTLPAPEYLAGVQTHLDTFGA